MFLLDTNICIYLINNRDGVLRERFEANAADIRISSITYAELCYGVAHSARQAANAQELEVFLIDLDILPFDQNAGRHYGEIRHALAIRGEPIGANDLLIAAHACSANATLVTNNAREFERVPGLRVENWMADPAA